MKKLFKYLKDFRAECVLGPLFKLFEAALELLVPIIVKLIIDGGIGGGNTSFAVKMVLLMVGMGAVGFVLSVIAQYFAAKASVGFAAKIRYALFRHIGKLSFTELDNAGEATLITRLTGDINQIQTGTNLCLRLLLRSPFVVFGAMIMAFTIDVKAALIFAASIPILSVIVFGIMLINIRLYKKVQSGLDGVLSKTRETLSGARVVRAFAKEDDEVREFKNRNSSYVASQKFVGKISALMNPLTYIVINIAVIVLIKQGAISVYAGALTQGAVVALYNYMSQILVELIKLANLIINITKFVACGNRVQAILDTEPEKSGELMPDTNSQTAVEFKNVYLKYSGAGDYSLEDISFSANKGETVGIIGATGCGKTSLINLIPGFYTAEKGEIRVFGEDVSRQNKTALLSKIGIVPQKASLFSGSIRKNMLIGNPRASDEEIISAITMAQGKDILSSKREGLDFRLSAGGKNLSGGQRQRLTIARALVKKPEILILDDSFSALDFATDAALRSAIRSLPFNPTVFMVSQRISSIIGADKILVLDDGKLVGCGTHSELLESCEIYREIYTSQSGEEAAV